MNQAKLYIHLEKLQKDLEAFAISPENKLKIISAIKVLDQTLKKNLVTIIGGRVTFLNL